MSRQPMKIICQSDDYACRVNFLFQISRNEDGSRTIIKPLVFETEKIESGALIDEPTMRLSTEEAKGLMNSLWDAGVRPSEWSARAFDNTIAAISEHKKELSDLVWRLMDSAFPKLPIIKASERDE